MTALRFVSTLLWVYLLVMLGALAVTTSLSWAWGLFWGTLTLWVGLAVAVQRPRLVATLRR